MKKFILIFSILALALVTLLQANASQVLNFQGVLKNPNGAIRPNSEATIVLEFQQDGVTIYSESHHITTNINGYFSFHPGGGTVIMGDYDAIDWGSGSIVMRTTLDGEIITSTPLTAVPYALYAEKVYGWDALTGSVDSIADAHSQTSLLLDDMVLSYEQLSLFDDSLDNRIELLHQYEVFLNQRIDSLQHYNDSLTARVDSLRHTADLLSIRLDSLSQCSDSLFAQVARNEAMIQQGANIFNATLYAPLESGQFHTLSTAIDAAPLHLRHGGTVVTFRCDSIHWRSIQYVGADTTTWKEASQWKEYGCYGNLTIPYIDNDSITRLSIPSHLRRQGLIVTYLKDSLVYNEQYAMREIDDFNWSNPSSWLSLSATQAELDYMQSLVDSLSNKVSIMNKDYEALLDVGKYYYINQNNRFTQAGAIDRTGAAITDYEMVHTNYIPIEDMWIIRTFGNKSYPGISFFQDKTPNSRIPFVFDSVTETSWQQQVFNFYTDQLPAGAQYFVVNMPLSKKKEVELTICNEITHTPVEVETHTYQKKQAAFTYNGAYVGMSGKRSINSSYSHSYFIPIDDTHYKITASGNYQQELTVPIVVYYSDLSFSACIGYDLGSVKDDRTTYGEVFVSRESAPEDAQYFIVNNSPMIKESIIMYGGRTDDMILDTQSRVEHLESSKSCSYGRKMVTIGDSFTINSNNRSTLWQEFLVDWLGVDWSYEETYSGMHGFAQMGYGGSWILPNDINSFSIRACDVKRYNPNIVILYGGQNDKLEKYKLGSIEDKPFIPEQTINLSDQKEVMSVATALSFMNNRYTKKNNTIINITEDYRNKLYFIADTAQWDDPAAWVAPLDTITFYSAYKGIVERLCTEIPLASIYCLTLMQCDSTRYDGSLGEWEALDVMRRTKNEAIKEIANFYGVTCIDLWNKSGITPLNARSHYGDWLHPNQYGYRKLAECIYRHLK